MYSSSSKATSFSSSSNDGLDRPFTGKHKRETVSSLNCITRDLHLPFPFPFSRIVGHTQAGAIETPVSRLIVTRIVFSLTNLYSSSSSSSSPSLETEASSPSSSEFCSSSSLYKNKSSLHLMQHNCTITYVISRVGHTHIPVVENLFFGCQSKANLTRARKL